MSIQSLVAPSSGQKLLSVSVSNITTTSINGTNHNNLVIPCNAAPFIATPATPKTEYKQGFYLLPGQFTPAALQIHFYWVGGGLGTSYFRIRGALPSIATVYYEAQVPLSGVTVVSLSKVADFLNYEAPYIVSVESDATSNINVCLASLNIQY